YSPSASPPSAAPDATAAPTASPQEDLMHDHAPADHQPEILAISGSLRTNSYNTQLLQLAAHLAAPAAHMPLWPHLADVPPFNEDHEAHPPQPVQAMRARISQTNAVLIATPEYNT